MSHEKCLSNVPELETHRRLTIERHVGRYVAPAVSVIHEIRSEVVHVDVHLVPPGDQHPFWFLFTTGMSALPMKMPDGVPGSRYAELAILLPPTWKVNQAAWSTDRWFWPLRELRELARHPHRYSTWIGCGHSIANAEPPRPYASSTKLAAMLVMHSVTLPPEAQSVPVDDITIELLTLWPLHRDELELKLSRGTDSLLDRFEAAGVSDIIDPDRPSALRGVLRDGTP